MPHGLAEWQAYLSEKKLPILSRTKNNVEKLIVQQQLSITQFAEPIIYDAGFCVQVMRQVNTQRAAAGRPSLTTLENALSHFGQDSFQSFLKNTQVFEEMSLPEQNQEGYLRVMGQACHAALQAKDWSQQRNVLLPQETQLATELQALTELMLWCYGDTLMQQLEELCYVKKQSYEEAAEKLLGCSMKQLGHALAEKWHLPEMTIDALSDSVNDYALSRGVALAYELARVVSLNWYGEKAEQVIQKIAKYKGKKEAEIERRIHLNAVDITDDLLRYGYQVPARLLPQLADDAHIYREFILQDDSAPDRSTPVAKVRAALEIESRTVNSKEKTLPPESNKSVPAKKMPATEAAMPKKTAVKTDKAEPPRPVVQEKITRVTGQADTAATQTPAKAAAIPAELAAEIRQFQRMVNEGAAAHDLIEHMVKASIYCGVDRCVFLVKVPNKQVLITRYMAYAKNIDKIKPIKIITDKPNVFSLLLEKTRSLFLTESNRGKYWNSIPDSAKLALGCKQFFAMSIFVKEHAMGIMYADKLKSGLNESEFKQFQGLCRLLSKGIVQSAQNKHKKKEVAV